jgi:uncharacterized protein YbjT (DUF2867 family)
MRILVTGATGTLGRPLVDNLWRSDVTIRVLSRHPAPAVVHGIEWVQGNFVTGTGLEEAVQEVDVLIHAAHDNRHASRDTQGVQAVVRAAEAAHVTHLVYVSVLGAGAVPGVGYYRAKGVGEVLVQQSHLSTAIFRPAQFFELIDSLFRRLDRLPWVLLPAGVWMQPVAVREVARVLADYARSGEHGVREFGGTEILSLRELAGTWLQARGKPKRIVEMPIPVKVIRALAQGKLTSTAAERGQTRWEEWLTAAVPP